MLELRVRKQIYMTSRPERGPITPLRSGGHPSLILAPMIHSWCGCAAPESMRVATHEKSRRDCSEKKGLSSHATPLIAVPAAAPVLGFWTVCSTWAPSWEPPRVPREARSPAPSPSHTQPDCRAPLCPVQGGWPRLRARAGPPLHRPQEAGGGDGHGRLLRVRQRR